MNVQPVGAGSYLITVTAAELGKDAGAITLADAEKLCGQLGHERGKNTRFDVYPGRDVVMIFVRAVGGAIELWEFDDPDDLLSAVREPASLCDSQLWLYRGRYILALTCWEGGCTPPRLCEFGRRLYASPELTAHIREQSETVTAGRAVETLKKR